MEDKAISYYKKVTKVKSKLEETTESDGKQALEQLRKLEDDLNEIKKSVDEHIVKE